MARRKTRTRSNRPHRRRHRTHKVVAQYPVPHEEIYWRLMRLPVPALRILQVIVMAPGGLSEPELFKRSPDSIYPGYLHELEVARLIDVDSLIWATQTARRGRPFIELLNRRSEKEKYPSMEHFRKLFGDPWSLVDRAQPKSAHLQTTVTRF